MIKGLTNLPEDVAFPRIREKIDKKSKENKIFRKMYRKKEGNIVERPERYAVVSEFPL